MGHHSNAMEFDELTVDPISPPDGCVWYNATEKKYKAHRNGATIIIGDAGEHAHSNKIELDLVTDGDHDVRADDPHNVTKVQVGLGSVDDLQQIPLSQKAASNGVCDLDAGGKVPSARLGLSNVVYAGTWNATTNTPVLADLGVGGAQGDYFVVSVAGATSIDGITDWVAGDWIINNGTIWEKADHTDLVSSVAGKIGAVTLVAADITDAGALATKNTVAAGDIDNDAVTYAKMQNVSATDRILGRDTAGAGVVEEITPSALRTMINVEGGSTADQTGAEIKSSYEAEADTNAFDDAASSKLAAISGTNTGDEPDATTAAKGIVEFATDGEVAASLAVQADDLRLDNERDADAIITTTGPTTMVVGAVAEGEFLKRTGATIVGGTPAGGGDVVGPAVAVADNIALFDGITGTLVKDSGSAVPVFGTEAGYAEDNGLSSTALTSPQQKLKHTTPSIPAGTYRIGWYFEQSNDKATIIVHAQVQVDDTDTLSTLSRKLGSQDEFYGESGFCYRTFGSAGAHDIDVDYWTDAGSGNGTNIKNARVEIWRRS